MKFSDPFERVHEAAAKGRRLSNQRSLCSSSIPLQLSTAYNDSVYIEEKNTFAGLKRCRIRIVCLIALVLTSPLQISFNMQCDVTKHVLLINNPAITSVELGLSKGTILLKMTETAAMREG